MKITVKSSSETRSVSDKLVSSMDDVLSKIPEMIELLEELQDTGAHVSDYSKTQTLMKVSQKFPDFVEAVETVLEDLT